MNWNPFQGLIRKIRLKALLESRKHCRDVSFASSIRELIKGEDRSFTSLKSILMQEDKWVLFSKENFMCMSGTKYPFLFSWNGDSKSQKWSRTNKSTGEETLIYPRGFSAHRVMGSGARSQDFVLIPLSASEKKLLTGMLTARVKELSVTSNYTERIEL